MGGFGITTADDLLNVRDVVLVQQRCTEVFVAFDDTSVADHFEDQVDQGRSPEQCGRIWIHTHPGDSAQPSGVDVETFQRAFGDCDWAVMFIIARNGATFADLHWKQGGPARIPLRVEVDFNPPFEATDPSAWDEEYTRCVEPEQWHDSHRPVLHRDLHESLYEEWLPHELNPLNADLLADYLDQP